MCTARVLHRWGACACRVMYLFLQPLRRVPSVVTDMLRLSCSQQRFAKKAECARASAIPDSRPNLPLSFSAPHFGVSQLNSPCIGCRESAPTIPLVHVHLWHFTHSAHIIHWHAFREKPGVLNCTSTCRLERVRFRPSCEDAHAGYINSHIHAPTANNISTHPHCPRQINTHCFCRCTVLPICCSPY